MFEDGEAGQVENVAGAEYCMKKSWQSRNNEEMNKGMKYADLADMANTAKAPTPVKAEKSNKQLGPKSSDNDYNYNADR